MEEPQTALIDRGDTGPYIKLLPDKDLYNCGTQDESNYVDLDNFLDMKSEGTQTLKVTFTGKGNQLAIFKCNSNKSFSGSNNTSECELNLVNLPTKDCKSNQKEHSGEVKVEKCVARDISFETESPSETPTGIDDFRDSPVCPDALTGTQTEIVPLDYKNVSSEKEKLQYTDMYLNNKGETEDCLSVVLSDQDAQSNTEDESHYITTHEIQLTELDHDVDCDFELESCWDLEEDNQVYSFVDYASFDSDDTIEGDTVDDGSLETVSDTLAQSNNTVECPASGSVVSIKHENDLCDLDKCDSSNESLSKTFQNGNGNSAGQIHLSIKTTSRAINKSSNVQETENILYHAKHEADLSRYVYKNTKAEGMSDRANCFIPAPGRVHFGCKFKGKDVNAYSSGASSSVSELDDADKEVRNLTARAFKSLALPYFDAINFSTSSESSASEHGLSVNSWSAFVDLKYGNMARGGEQKLISQKSATSTLDANKNGNGKAINGLTQASVKQPQTKIFALNGNQPNPPKPSSTTKNIELKGNLEQGQSGLITLTETLNFSCNVKAGVPASERRAKFAEIAQGSRSTDEVTGTLPSEQGTEAGIHHCETGEASEGTHKKAMFASSLLKNVISKKMQFEQERKMERGEIQDTYPAGRENEANKEKVAPGESRDLQKQNSNFSAAGLGLVNSTADEPVETSDDKSCVPKNETEKNDTLTHAPETSLESKNETGFENKKHALESSKLLLPSQNSAFRSWKNGEKDAQGDKILAGTTPSNTGKISIGLDAGSRFTKKTQLFVPNIQSPSKGRGIGKQVSNIKDSARAAQDQGGGGKQRTDGSVVTSRSPEIKISLRSVKENKKNQFNIANLLTPKIGYTAGNAVKTANSSKPQALIASLKGEWAEKAPHFMVRDIRDNKYKLLTPIHQVRDVRKLVKSSYHFVSLDNQENKAVGSAADAHGEQKASRLRSEKGAALFAPMVIKCQSVNTNNNVKQSGNFIAVSRRRLVEDRSEADRSPPQLAVNGGKNGTTMLQRTTGRVPLVSTKHPNTDQPEVPAGVKSEPRAAKQKKENISDTGEKKTESKVANQVALEKLQAAVKTMEQLYVFNRNEWKRKNKAPQPVTDSHVLSLIASEEQGSTGRAESDEELGNITGAAAPGSERPDKSPPTLTAETASEVSPKKVNEYLKNLHIPCNREAKYALKTTSQQSGVFSNKNVLTNGSGQKVSASTSIIGNKAPQPYASSTKNITPKVPLSLKISHPKCAIGERERPNFSEADKPSSAQPSESIAADSGGNYLTIPVSAQTNEVKPSAASGQEQTATCAFSPPAPKLHGPGLVNHKIRVNMKRQDQSSQSPERFPVVMETQSPDTPTATIYHHSLGVAGQGGQQQVICFSPSAPQPATPSTDPFQQTQKKMLLDPTTGQYYLVDTPVTPATKKLFDPETGQFMDVPMSQQHATPVPMALSPLAALSPGPYTPTYVIYPGFLPSPPTALPARSPNAQPSTHSDADDGGENRPAGREPLLPGRPGDAPSDSPYCIPPGTSPQLPLASQHVTTRGSKDTSDGKPVINITSQQGPRIVAPPSFDGTTMSFVVEHR